MTDFQEFAYQVDLEPMENVFHMRRLICLFRLRALKAIRAEGRTPMPGEASRLAGEHMASVRLKFLEVARR